MFLNAFNKEQYIKEQVKWFGRNLSHVTKKSALPDEMKNTS